MSPQKLFATLAICILPLSAHAGADDAPVVVSGTVPDVAAKTAILDRLRALFGAQRVLDRIAVGGVIAPPDWNRQVQSVLTDKLRDVKNGTLKVEGTTIQLQGKVGSAPIRKELASALVGGIDPAYTLRNDITGDAQEQSMVDAALDRRIVEFEPGKATLTMRGKAILDDIAGVLGKLQGKRFEVAGHTDNRGQRTANIALSEARAEAVKEYLAGKGVPAGAIAVQGKGPDEPVADNATEEGRARNRRIEFRVL